MAAHDFLKRISKCPSGQECITVGGPPAFPISIMEDSCLACLNRAKRCPGGALRIINMPSNLTTNVTHQYGLNSFKLHGLPTPRAGNVLGILGCNGIGKSTALNTLCGRLKPNLGRLKEPPGWADIMAYYRGSDLHTPPRPSAALCVLDSRACTTRLRPANLLHALLRGGAHRGAQAAARRSDGQRRRREEGARHLRCRRHRHRQPRPRRSPLRLCRPSLHHPSPWDAPGRLSHRRRRSPPSLPASTSEAKPPSTQPPST